VRRILLESGYRVQSEILLDRLEKRGARVDRARQVFWPSPEMRAAVEDCARRLAPETSEVGVLRRPAPGGARIGYNCTLYYDHSDGSRRRATLEDVRTMARLCHTLPEVGALGAVMTATDIPAPIEPIVSYAETLKLTDKPLVPTELILPGQVPFLEELNSIAAGRHVPYDQDGCAPSRFTVDARAAGCVLAVWQRNGLRQWVTSSCPVAGASAPMTLGGAVVVGVAETVGAWFVGWVLNEDVTLGAIPCSGVLDMRTTRVLFSAPEAVLIDVGIYQVLERILGVRAGMLANYTDAPVPGMQAVNDKVFKALAYAWLTNQLNPQRGTLDAGKAFSPTELLVDLELDRQLAQLAHGFAASEEDLCVEEIVRYGLDFDYSFLASEHTYAHYRRVLWFPSLMDRQSCDAPEEAQGQTCALLERAETNWRKSLAGYTQPDIPADTLRAVDRVVARARQALL
ncbi:MAG: trimethylamine methyltransferase family protein, partial [Anaerolineae bacterium]